MAVGAALASTQNSLHVPARMVRGLIKGQSMCMALLHQMVDAT